MRTFLTTVLILGICLMLAGFIYSFTNQIGILAVIAGVVMAAWSAVDLAFLPNCRHPHGGDPDWF